MKIKVTYNKMSTDKFDPYTVLELARNCNDDDINAAYKSKSKIYHPDKPGGDAIKFGQCTKAKNLLLDRQKRNMYDRGGWEAVLQYEQMQQMQASRRMKCEPVNLKLRVGLEQVYRRDVIHIKETLPEKSGDFVLDLKLDPGMIGHGICVENKGICRDDYVTGDVIIHLELDPRSPFKVNGLNLVLEYKMQLADLLGFTLQIDHPSGTAYSIKSKYDNPDRNGNMVLHFPNMGLTGGDDTGEMIVIVTPDLSNLPKLPKRIISELQATLDSYRKYNVPNSKAVDITDKAQQPPPPRMMRGLAALERFRMPPGVQFMSTMNDVPMEGPSECVGGVQ